MNTADKKNFKDLLTNAMAFYRQDVSTFALDVWWNACERFEFEQVAKAFTRHAVDPERGQYAPKPADVVRLLGGTSTDRAAVAWGKTHDAMSSVGAYSDVVFDDPIIHAVIDDLGGWPKVCRTELDELSYLQHRFTESYRAYVARGVTDYPRRLRGDRGPDELFAKRGLPPPKPAVVGDVDQARQVFKAGQLTGKTAITFAALDALDSGLKRLPVLKEIPNA